MYDLAANGADTARPLTEKYLELQNQATGRFALLRQGTT
jgi:hypothetical protein